MKYFTGIATVVLAVVGVVAPAEVEARPASQPKPQRVVNRVAATVNGRPITSAEVRARLEPYIRELMMRYPTRGAAFSAAMVKAKKEAMQDLIERELVLSEFESKGYSIPESAVEDEISRRVLHQFSGKRSKMLESLRRSGLTYSEYRDSVRKEITVSAMRASRYDRGIPPTPDEIRAEYNATRSEYRDPRKDSIVYDKIYIPFTMEDPTMTPDDQIAFARQLAVDIRAGKISFADAARQYSRDRHAQDGGRWPRMKRSDLSVEFANIVFDLKKGTVSDPLLDNSGLTIVRVVKVHQAAAPPLSNPKVKAAVDEAVRRKQGEKRYRQWVKGLRETAIIRTYI